MNGSENGYAGALFFALMSFGALLKFDDLVGWSIGAGCAILAAISLRFALIKSAQAVEEDHQRMEIQFQQLRSKIIEVSAVSIEAMNSVNDAAKLVQENLQVIRVRLAELDNLTHLAEDSQELRSAAATLNSTLEQLNAATETNKELLQVIAQLIKNQSYSSDFGKINSSIILVDEETK